MLLGSVDGLTPLEEDRNTVVVPTLPSLTLPSSLLCVCCDGGSEGITAWVKKKTGPAAVTLGSAAELEKLEKEAEVLVLGYFKALKVRLDGIQGSVAGPKPWHTMFYLCPGALGEEALGDAVSVGERYGGCHQPPHSTIAEALSKHCR